MNVSRYFATIVAAVFVVLSSGLSASAMTANPALEGDPMVQPATYTTIDGRPAILRCTNTPHVLLAVIWDEETQTFEHQEVKNEEVCSDYRGPEQLFVFGNDPMDVRVHPVYIVLDRDTIAVARCTADLPQLLIVHWDSEAAAFEWQEVPSMMCLA